MLYALAYRVIWVIHRVAVAQSVTSIQTVAPLRPVSTTNVSIRALAQFVASMLFAEYNNTRQSVAASMASPVMLSVNAYLLEYLRM